MNKKSLLKIINKEVTILSDFIEGFSDVENIHPKEVDLVLSKVNDIYEELLLLKDKPSVVEHQIKANVDKKIIGEIAETKVAGEVEVNTEREEEKPVEDINKTATNIENEEKEGEEREVVSRDTIEQEFVADKNPEQVVGKIEEEVKPESVSQDDIVKTEENVEIEYKEVVQKTVPEQDADDEQSEEIENGKIIIADRFLDRAPSINDVLAGVKTNADLASKLKDSPISDLRKAIKLNDRIWFVNELFNKNPSSYERAIDKINSADNLDEALEYLFTTFDWDQKRKSTINFLELVFRRFAINQK